MHQLRTQVWRQSAWGRIMTKSDESDIKMEHILGSAPRNTSGEIQDVVFLGTITRHKAIIRLCSEETPSAQWHRQHCEFIKELFRKWDAGTNIPSCTYLVDFSFLASKLYGIKLSLCCNCCRIGLCFEAIKTQSKATPINYNRLIKYNKLWSIFDLGASPHSLTMSLLEWGYGVGESWVRSHRSNNVSCLSSRHTDDEYLELYFLIASIITHPTSICLRFFYNMHYLWF